MSRYRRPRIEGGRFFFTVVLVDRSSKLLIQHIERLRQVYRAVQSRLPFETNAICILPDHLHAIWTLSAGDADFASRWGQIKSGFSREVPAAQLNGAINLPQALDIWTSSSLDRSTSASVKKNLPPSIVGRRYRDITRLWHGCTAGKMAAEVYFRAASPNRRQPRRDPVQMMLIERPTACAKSL